MALAAWLGSLALAINYAHNLPESPDPGKGRVYEINSHGKFVYLTRSERDRMYILRYVALGFFVGAMGIGYAKGEIRPRR